MRQTRDFNKKPVMVVGGGLAGCEAAWQLASRGIPVELFEMRPHRKTEAHTTDHLAELVCSNSFGSDAPHAASKILKEELSRLGGFIIKAARESAVPAGASLAVDRDRFAEAVTEGLQSLSLVTLRREEVTSLPDDRMVVVATGPLTSPELSAALARLIGEKSLYFYDAISPIVSTDSLDLEKLFFQSRYDKGEADYLNIPLTKDQYDEFVNELVRAEVVLAHDFEEEKYFESCMPIETIASRGHLTLAYGPMKPVGLTDPKTGKRPYAVIQLRTENQHRTAYNLVGFQTKMKYKEQERLFRKLPGLEQAEFLRLGSMHRNTYLHSPRVLEPTLKLKAASNIFVAGQLTGTEGYLESSATGLLAGWNAARLYRGEALVTLPPSTMLGALLGAVTDPTKENFQPMNSNIGILPPLDPSVMEGKKKLDRPTRNRLHSERAVMALETWLRNVTETSRPAEHYNRSSQCLAELH